MTDESVRTLRIWGRRARRLVRWFGRRDRQDRIAMWHLDRLAIALSNEGWRTKRLFTLSPPAFRVGPTNHATTGEELTAIHFGRRVYRSRSSPCPIPCADPTRAVTDDPKP
jgi:hypothetical protein